MAKIQANSAKTSFWATLPKPFFVLAPMANVTDFVFRSIIAKYGKPDVMWTEFVSADGLCSQGKGKLLFDLKFSEKERPIVVQLFTGHPDVMRKAAKLCAELGFDGLDINMGCPDRAVEKQGGGADLIRNPENAVEIIRAARRGWEEGGQRGKEKEQRLKNKEKRLRDKMERGGHDEGFARAYVSVKTRIGYNAVDMDWIRLLLMQKLPALTIHLRTRKEMSDVPAHWELMPEIVKLRNDISPETLIIGNGDVKSLNDGLSKMKKYGNDGVMIGTGIFGTPWLFEKLGRTRVGNLDAKAKTPKERLKIMVEHSKLFEKTFCGKERIKNFAVMKKHFKAYVSGWDGAKELRVKLMEGAMNAKEVEEMVGNPKFEILST
ncbi:MAG: hypothetical protein RL536_493 [Candidatus Parcubacteria bacterium]|jgi:tRNA-dihydrouridine synthase